MLERNANWFRNAAIQTKVFVYLAYFSVIIIVALNSLEIDILRKWHKRGSYKKLLIGLQICEVLLGLFAVCLLGVSLRIIIHHSRQLEKPDENFELLVKDV